MKHNHNYSQVFLRSPRLVAELVGHSNIRKNDTVYDIGAGSGIISSVLARRCKHVYAIEPEKNAYEKLCKNTQDQHNITPLYKDFLSMDLPKEKYKIFANIPFHLSSKIIHKITTTKHCPTSTYLIVQKQFAQKLIPSDHRFTAQIGSVIAPWFTVRIRRPLKRSDYTPRPNVDTCLIEIKPRETPLLERSQQYAFTDFVGKCYADPKVFAETDKKQAGISPERKPSEVTPEQWVRLYQLS